MARITNDAIAREAHAAISFLQMLMPVSWRFEWVKVCSSKAYLAKVVPIPDADGGRAFGIIISRLRLNGLNNWRDGVWSRCLHEMMHLRLWDQWHEISPPDTPVVQVDLMVENACESIEIFGKTAREHWERVKGEI